MTGLSKHNDMRWINKQIVLWVIFYLMSSPIPVPIQTSKMTRLQLVARVQELETKNAKLLQQVSLLRNKETDLKVEIDHLKLESVTRKSLVKDQLPSLELRRATEKATYYQNLYKNLLAEVNSMKNSRSSANTTISNNRSDDSQTRQQQIIPVEYLKDVEMVVYIDKNGNADVKTNRIPHESHTSVSRSSTAYSPSNGQNFNQMDISAPILEAMSSLEADNSHISVDAVPSKEAYSIRKSIDSPSNRQLNLQSQKSSKSIRSSGSSKKNIKESYFNGSTSNQRNSSNGSQEKRMISQTVKVSHPRQQMRSSHSPSRLPSNSARQQDNPYFVTNATNPKRSIKQISKLPEEVYELDQRRNSNIFQSTSSRKSLTSSRHGSLSKGLNQQQEPQNTITYSGVSSPRTSSSRFNQPETTLQRGSVVSNNGQTYNMQNTSSSSHNSPQYLHSTMGSLKKSVLSYDLPEDYGVRVTNASKRSSKQSMLQSGACDALRVSSCQKPLNSSISFGFPQNKNGVQSLQTPSNVFDISKISECEMKVSRTPTFYNEDTRMSAGLTLDYSAGGSVSQKQSAQAVRNSQSASKCPVPLPLKLSAHESAQYQLEQIMTDSSMNQSNASQSYHIRFADTQNTIYQKSKQMCNSQLLANNSSSMAYSNTNNLLADQNGQSMNLQASRSPRTTLESSARYSLCSQQQVDIGLSRTSYGVAEYSLGAGSHVKRSVVIGEEQTLLEAAAKMMRNHLEELCLTPKQLLALPEVKLFLQISQNNIEMAPKIVQDTMNSIGLYFDDAMCQAVTEGQEDGHAIMDILLQAYSDDSLFLNTE